MSVHSFLSSPSVLERTATERAGWDSFSIYTFAFRGCWESLSLIKDLNKHIASAVIKLLSFVREGAVCQQFVDLDINVCFCSPAKYLCF